MLGEAKGFGEEGGDGYGWTDKLRRGSYEIVDCWRRKPENGEQVLGLTQSYNGYSAQTQTNGITGSSPALLKIIR